MADRRPQQQDAIATICQTVLCLPHLPAEIISPLLAASRRRPVTRNSREMMTTAIHAGTSLSSTKLTKAAQTSTLSVSGSISRPNDVTP